jgi:hypothetical protein
LFPAAEIDHSSPLAKTFYWDSSEKTWQIRADAIEQIKF